MSKVLSGNAKTPAWGILPEAMKRHFQVREWQNEKHLRDRLNGSRQVDMRLGLKPPTGKQALSDLVHFEHFVESWKRWPQQSQLIYEKRKFRQIGEVNLPVRFQIDSFQQLVETLGPPAASRSKHWQQVMQPLLEIDESLYSVLVRHLAWLDTLTIGDAQQLAALLRKLKPGMGGGQYLRALPIPDIHTKFIETHENQLSELLNVIHNNEIIDMGGFRPWLNCLDSPSNWVMIKPLCSATRHSLGSLPLLQLDTVTLQKNSLPAARIIIVENDQSGLGLPGLKNTIAVMGGGNNLSWLRKNDWISDCEVKYWGDIDSWGFRFLDAARARQAHIQSTMMDMRTLEAFKPHLGHEPQSNWLPLKHLTEAESSLFLDLSRDRFNGNRLEQEKLSPGYIRECLAEWM